MSYGNLSLYWPVIGSCAAVAWVSGVSGGKGERWKRKNLLSPCSLGRPDTQASAAGSEYACLSYKMTAFFTTERILNVLKACLTLTNKMFPPWSNHTRQYATRKPPEIKQMAAILIFALWEKPGESAEFGSEGRSGKDRRRSRALCISSKFPEISVRQ